MIEQLGPDIHFNNQTQQTSVNPLGIGVFFKPLVPRIDSFGAGYLFGGYSRPISITGHHNELVFWDLCSTCPLYQQRKCSGGYKVLTTVPGYDWVNFINVDGNRQRAYFNKEFCQRYYDSATLSSALNGSSNMTVNLLPHFVFLKGNRKPYWFLYKPNLDGDELVFLPYQVFNTWGSGEMCLGTTNVTNTCSVPNRYESFLSSRMNRDLNPTRGNKSPVEWARTFTPEALISYSNNYWKSASRLFGTSVVFAVLPPVFTKIKFLLCLASDLPDFLRPSVHSSTTRQVVPFVKDSEGQWFSTYNLEIAVTDEFSSLHL